METTTVTDIKRIDPRIIRTQRLLLDSFTELLHENVNIRKISIQDITRRAGVNRVTFYAHFTDKYQLLAVWKRDVFRKALMNKLPDIQNVSDISFEQLVDTILDFMFAYRPKFLRINQEYEPILQAALHEELTTIVAAILAKDVPKSPATPLQTRATFLGWAILGTTHEWCTNHGPETKPTIAAQLLELIQEKATN